MVGAGFDSLGCVVELPGGAFGAAAAIESAAADLKVSQHVGNDVAVTAENNGASGEGSNELHRACSRCTFEEFGCDLHAHAERFGQWFHGLNTAQSWARVHGLDVLVTPFGGDDLCLVDPDRAERSLVIGRILVVPSSGYGMANEKQRHVVHGIQRCLTTQSTTGTR